MNSLFHLSYFSTFQSLSLVVFLYCIDDNTSIMSKRILKCLCIENFEYTFLAKIETSVFPMHEYHIVFVLTGENGVEISICFAALGANFDSHCVMS